MDFNKAHTRAGRRRHLRSTAVALLALFSALGGTAWALGANSITGRHVADDTLESPTATIVCDGETDTTAAIQAAINDARRPGGVGGRVELPAGTCVVSRTLVLRGLAGMILVGQGVPTTNLEWVATPRRRRYSSTARSACGSRTSQSPRLCHWRRPFGSRTVQDAK